MADAEAHEKIGKLFGLYEGMKDTIDKVEKNQEAQNAKIDAQGEILREVRQILGRAGDGWKIFLAIGSGVAAFATAATWVCEKIGLHIRLGN